MPTNISFANDISHLFRDRDIACMKREANMDLSDYESVKRWAGEIYTELKERRMPKDGAYWTVANIELLKNWIDDGMKP